MLYENERPSAKKKIENCKTYEYHKISSVNKWNI